MEQKTFQFVASWILTITLLMLMSRSRVGYVIIYYALLLMILFLMVVEYKQIAPLLRGIESTGQFNAQNS